MSPAQGAGPDRPLRLEPRVTSNFGLRFLPKPAKVRVGRRVLRNVRL